MKFSIPIIVTALLAAVQAAPAVSPENPILEARKNDPNDEGRCGQSTYENENSKDSPLAADCQQLSDNLKDYGTFEDREATEEWKVVTMGSHRQLAQYKSCAFGVECPEETLNVAYVANPDVQDIIRASIDQFEFDGKIGAKGEMRCASDKGIAEKPKIVWGIYRNGHK